MFSAHNFFLFKNKNKNKIKYVFEFFFKSKIPFSFYRENFVSELHSETCTQKVLKSRLASNK